MKTFKDKISTDFGKIKLDVEIITRHLNELKHQIENNIKESIIKTLERNDKSNNNQLEDMKKNIDSIKIDNGKYHLEAMKNVKIQQEEFGKFFIEKEKLDNQWKVEMEILDDYKMHFDTMKTKFIHTEGTHTKIEEILREMRKKLHALFKDQKALGSTKSIQDRNLDYHSSNSNFDTDNLFANKKQTNKFFKTSIINKRKVNINDESFDSNNESDKDKEVVKNKEWDRDKDILVNKTTSHKLGDSSKILRKHEKIVKPKERLSDYAGKSKILYNLIYLNIL